MGEASQISAVIFDLDGTILDTQRHVPLVLKEFLSKYGKVMDAERELKRVGQVHKVSAAGIVSDYDLPLTPDGFSEAIVHIYKSKWPDVKALPGANRLIRHLHKHGVPFAIASNSTRRNIETKISYQKGWKELFPVIIGVDDVREGKPSPDMFLEAARRLGVEASECLVLEDSLVGVEAAKSAGMKVVAVPSVMTKIKEYSLASCVIHSILEFIPELWGLPSFECDDEDAIEIEPFCIKGKVGEEEYLSDLDTKEFEVSPDDSPVESLQDQLFGYFFGWCKTDEVGIIFHKVVVSVGWDLTPTIPKRKIKACLIGEGHHPQQSTTERLEMVMVGYLKKLYPMELEPLEIQEDAKNIAIKSLDLPKFAML